MRMLIMGPPGSGKGTQADRIAQRYNVSAISTGEIFRRNIADATELGLKVKRIMEAGDYVSDEITEAIVGQRLDSLDGGFLLDGFPRTSHQVEWLTRFLSERGHALDAVVSLEVPTDELVRRIAQRAAEQGRNDDTEDTVRRRMEVYAESTAELLDSYQRQGVLYSVDGTGTIDEVTARLFEVLDGVREHRTQD